MPKYTIKTPDGRTVTATSGTPLSDSDLEELTAPSLFDPGGALGDFRSRSGGATPYLQLPNLVGAGVRAIGGAAKGLAALPFLAYKGVTQIPETAKAIATQPGEVASVVGEALGQAPGTFWDWLKQAGPTDIAAAGMEPLAGYGIGAAAPRLLSGAAKAVVRNTPGASVGAQLGAKRTLEGMADRIRPPGAPDISSLYEAPLAEGAAAGTTVPLPSLRAASEKILAQQGQRAEGLKSSIGRPARGLQKALAGEEPVQVDTGMVDAGGNPIMQTAMRPASGALPLGEVSENLKGINELIGALKAKGGGGLGGARLFSSGLHSDLRAAAAAPGADPAIQGLMEAVQEGEKQFLADQLRHAMRPGGGIVGTRPSGDFAWARPQKMMDWFVNHPQWEQRVGQIFGQPFVDELKAGVSKLIPMTERALPKQAGANVGSYQAVGSGLLGSAGAHALGGNPITGAALGHVIPRFLSALMQTRPGIAAAQRAFELGVPIGFGTGAGTGALTATAPIGKAEDHQSLLYRLLGMNP